jgi:hypothetical protein
VHSQWELIEDTLRGGKSERLFVPGGWIVRTALRVDTGPGYAVSVAQTFISDPEHSWIL